jgi:hypothetical protein
MYTYRNAPILSRYDVVHREVDALGVRAVL